MHKELIFVVVVGLLITSCKKEEDWLQEQKNCNTPKKVAQVDGVTLYKVYPNCRNEPVYFSKSGTQTTIREAKHTKEVLVPNVDEEYAE